jgi:hypothetical protein
MMTTLTRLLSKILDKSIELMHQRRWEFFKGVYNAIFSERRITWNGINIHRVDRHGSGEILKMMGKTDRIYIESKEPTNRVYRWGAIWTDDNRKEHQKFDLKLWYLMNSGGARIQGMKIHLIIMDAKHRQWL